MRPNEVKRLQADFKSANVEIAELRSQIESGKIREESLKIELKLAKDTLDARNKWVKKVQWLLTIVPSLITFLVLNYLDLWYGLSTKNAFLIKHSPWLKLIYATSACAIGGLFYDIYEWCAGGFKFKFKFRKVKKPKVALKDREIPAELLVSEETRKKIIEAAQRKGNLGQIEQTALPTHASQVVPLLPAITSDPLPPSAGNA